MKIIIVGAGTFGLSTAFAFAQNHERYPHIQIIDPTCTGEPYELASTTDISKLIRGDYGEQKPYADLTIQAIRKWRQWNQESDLGTLFYEVGMMILSRQPLEADPTGFAAQSFEYMMNSDFYKAERISDSVRERFPAFNWEIWKDGYFQHTAGWGNSSRATTFLKRKLKQMPNVEMTDGFVEEVLKENGAAKGVRLRTGACHYADLVVVAGGSWTPQLVPQMYNFITPNAQYVIHAVCENKSDFEAQHVPPALFDIANTGLYAFPLHPDQQVIKMARHTLGIPLEKKPITSDLLTSLLPEAQEAQSNNILNAYQQCFAPSHQPINLTQVHHRLCTYCDTLDGHFVVDWVKDVSNLFVVCGGSGHGFKFMPVIGDFVLDQVEGRTGTVPYTWRWKEGAKKKESKKTDPQINRPGLALVVQSNL